MNVTSGSASQDRLIINAHIHTSPGPPQQIIARHSILLGLNPTELYFPITFLRPQLAAYKIEVTGQSLATNRTFSTSTQLSRLLLRQDGGSIARIDQKYSSIQVLSGYPNHPPSNPSLNPPAQQILSNHISWTPIFPFSFYLAGPWLSSSASNMAHFKSLGYNVLHIIPDIGEGYSWPELSRWLDEAERLDLWLMFDMRHQYQDPAWISRIIPMIAKRSNMLLWYTTDEPDGHEDPLDAPQRVYNQIKKLDPYHPISLCLNCENYHFEEYASGADILLADTYPIGTNTSFSTVWGTECNTTYGCCGCDNCHGIDNITNVAERFDTWRSFQTQLGWNVQKPIWTVPQAFGPELHWQRRPDPREIVAMTAIAMNHGAKGSVAWMWPTPEDLVQPISHLAKVLTDPEVMRFTLSARLIPSSDFHVQGTRSTSLDIAGWIDVPNDRILISIVNAAHEDIPGPVSITVPDAIQITGIPKTWWGDGGWRVASPATTEAKRRHNLLLNDERIRGMNVDLFTTGLVSNREGEVLNLPPGGESEE